MNALVRMYTTLLLRRAPVMILLFMICATLGIGLAMTLPAKYRATATLLVESPEIDARLAGAPVSTVAEEQIQIIQTRLRTRANLIDLANKYRVFADRGRMSPDEVVTEMRSRISVNTSSGRGRATLVNIRFESENPQMAANIVNETTTFILSEDSRVREAQAGGTLEFFEDEVGRLSDGLVELAADILEFKAANRNSLPDAQSQRLTRRDQLQDTINIAMRDRSALTEQKARLEAARDISGGNIPGVPKSPAQQKLEAAQNELASALTIYSDSNPRVRILEAQVARLETEVAAEIGPVISDANGAETLLDLQLAEIDQRVEELNASIARSEAEIEALQTAIDRSPETAIGLETLERQYERLQREYDQAAQRLSTAKQSERINVLDKGARLSLIEAATVPTEPFSPDRQMIAAAGVVGGLGLAGGFFLLLELLNRAVRRPQDLVKALNVQPLAVLPYLESPGARRTRRMLKVFVAFLVLIGTPAVLWAIHEFYLPLDLVIEKVLDRLGV